MEYNFRPQWKPWNFQSSVYPICGRCGNNHFPWKCFASNKQCFSCRKYGHYARTCFTKHRTQQLQKPNGTVTKVKSNSQKKRDFTRMRKFMDNKQILREMPFSNVRNTTLKVLFLMDKNDSLKGELKSIKCHLKQQQRNFSELKGNFENEVSYKLASVESKLQQEKQEHDELRKNFEIKISELNSISLEREQLKTEITTLTGTNSQSATTAEQCYINQIQALQQSITSKNNCLQIISEQHRIHSSNYWEKQKSWEIEKDGLNAKIQTITSENEQLKQQLEILKTDNQRLGNFQQQHQRHQTFYYNQNGHLNYPGFGGYQR